jgi:hypothetical protein
VAYKPSIIRPIQINSYATKRSAYKNSAHAKISGGVAVAKMSSIKKRILLRIMAEFL